MIGITEKIGRRKITGTVLLVGIAVFSVVYALFQTKSGFAVLTSPPPGIPGPYYVTAEAKIYGPVVDLAAIKSKTGGTYASDYTYVQWETNPLYRVYVDNTIQEVYYGQMVDVLDQTSWRPGRGWPPWWPEVGALEFNLNATYNSLKDSGAIDPTSIIGSFNYFGNMPGTYITVFDTSGYNTLNITGKSWHATEVHAHAGGYSGMFVSVSLNGSDCVSASAGGGMWEEDTLAINASGIEGVHLMNWKILMSRSGLNQFYCHGAVAIFLEDLTTLQTDIPVSSYKVYTVIDSPGTGFVSKYVSPSSPVIGSTITVTVRLDPPAASKMNITDLYPNTFTWTGVQVTLQKFRIGVGLVATASVSATPTPDGSNMKFTVYYNQATDILQSLLSDDFVYMSYTLTAPSTSGEYTLPSASMTYLIPLPQT